MKKLLHNWSIKLKLIFIIMSSVLLSLLLAGMVIVINERDVMKQSMTERLMTIGRIIADRSTAALSFDDQKSATDILSTLNQESTVLLACMYDRSQSLFARYAVHAQPDCPINPQQEGYTFLSDSFELYLPIILEGGSIGTLHFRATLKELEDRQLEFVILMMSIFSIVGIAAYILAVRQQAVISKPILELANVAKQISIHGNYAVQLPQDTNDEIGILNRAFNNMLAQIHKRQLARDVAEQALVEREQDLLITLNSIGDAVITTDSKGYVTRMNPVAEQLTGWSHKSAQGQPLNTIFSIIDATTRVPIENPVDKVIATGETIFLSNHTTLISRDGSEYQIADSAAPIRSNDNILGMVLVFNDVSEQYQLRQQAELARQSLLYKEKEQRDMLNSMVNAVISINEHGKILSYNKAAEDLFGYSVSEIIGENVKRLMPEHYAAKHDGFLQHYIQTGDARVIGVGREVEGQCKNKDTFPLQLLVAELPKDADGTRRFIGSCIDLTHSKQQEEQLRRGQKMDALGKLTGGIAHDYNNLLAIIRGYAEQLGNSLSHDSRLTKYVQDIQHAADRGTKLTKKLLNFSQQRNSDATVLDINKLLREQQLMLEKTLTARVKLVLDLEEKLWPVELDSSDLEDVIINMCINAMHAMESGGQLTLRTSNEQLNTLDGQQLDLEPGDYVLLIIIDTGCGMNKDTKEKIFDPFYTTKGDGGTGLGLSQVYGFIESIGGTIKVYSELGYGTRFALYFPRSHRTVAENQSQTLNPAGNQSGSETLLVVDDEEALVDLAHEILTQKGYRVLRANDGVQAMKILAKEAVDLIISDVIMPNMDGYQLAAKVQQFYPHIKLLMVSGFTDNRHNNLMDASLIQNMLSKPYTASSLLTHVRNLLNEGNIIKKVILSGRTILVMDDEVDIQELFKLSLNKLGCKTILANNGEDAIAIYRQSLESDKHIDVVILDLSIPGGLNGKEVAEKIRSMDTHARIVVASGHSVSPEMTRYSDYGFDGALEKDFDRDAIKRVLEQVLARR